MVNTTHASRYSRVANRVELIWPEPGCVRHSVRRTLERHLDVGIAEHRIRQVRAGERLERRAHLEDTVQSA